MTVSSDLEVSCWFYNSDFADWLVGWKGWHERIATFCFPLVQSALLPIFLSSWACCFKVFAFGRILSQELMDAFTFVQTFLCLLSICPFSMLFTSLPPSSVPSHTVMSGKRKTTTLVDSVHWVKLWPTAHVCNFLERVSITSIDSQKSIKFIEIKNHCREKGKVRQNVLSHYLISFLHFHSSFALHFSL